MYIEKIQVGNFILGTTQVYTVFSKIMYVAALENVENENVA